MRSIKLALLLGLLTILALPGAARADGPISVEADALEFSPDGQSVRAEGHVALAYLDISIQADLLVKTGKMVSASGRVKLVSRTAELSADRIELDLETRALSAEGLRGRMGDFFVSAARLSPGASGEEVLTDASLTRCDLATPCYELRAGRIAIAGQRVTVERGWLALKGRRVLPLPRLSLDLDEWEKKWPQFSLGYGDEGICIGARITVPLEEATDFVFDCELAAADPLTLRAGLAWKPADGYDVAPWFSYSVADGFAAGLDLGLSLAGCEASLAAAYAWAEPRWEARFTLGRTFSDSWYLGGFWSGMRAGADPALIEAGGVLRWTSAAEDASSLSLMLGHAWTGGSDAPLIRLKADLAHRFGDWGFDTSFGYDLIADLWYDCALGITRYLHCYYVRLGYDLTAGSFSISGGLTF